MPSSEDGGLFLRSAAGPGPGVLWIHGYTLDGSIFEHLWGALPGFRHLAVDLPGHGRSRALHAHEDLSSLARSLLDLARRAEVRHLIALSFGTMLALEMACLAPDRFRSVTLAGATFGGAAVDPESQRCNGDLINLYRERGPGPWLQERWMATPPDIFRGARAHPQLFSRLQAVVARHRFTELSNGAMRALTEQAQSRRAMRDLTGSLLLLVGEHEMSTFRRSAEVLRRTVPHARREYVGGAGHLCLLERPQACLSLVHQQLVSTIDQV